MLDKEWAEEFAAEVKLYNEAEAKGEVENNVIEEWEDSLSDQWIEMNQETRDYTIKLREENERSS